MSVLYVLLRSVTVWTVLSAFMVHDCGYVTWTSLGPLYTLSFDSVGAGWVWVSVCTAAEFCVRITKKRTFTITPFDACHVLLIAVLLQHGSDQTASWIWQSKDYVKDTLNPPAWLRQYEGEMCAGLPFVVHHGEKRVLIQRSIGRCVFTVRGLG